jgi:hypothetical protein
MLISSCMQMAMTKNLAFPFRKVNRPVPCGSPLDGRAGPVILGASYFFSYIYIYMNLLCEYDVAEN